MQRGWGLLLVVYYDNKLLLVNSQFMFISSLLESVEMGGIIEMGVELQCDTGAAERETNFALNVQFDRLIIFC